MNELKPSFSYSAPERVAPLTTHSEDKDLPSLTEGRTRSARTVSGIKLLALTFPY